MNSKFYKDKKNYILKEYEPGEAAARASMSMVAGKEAAEQAFPRDAFKVTDSDTLLDIVNISLDVIGIFDPSGIADGANMLIYLGRNQYINAFFSLIGAVIPYLGDVFKVASKVSLPLLEEAMKLLSDPNSRKIIRKLLNFAETRGFYKFTDWVMSFIDLPYKKAAEYLFETFRDSKQIMKDAVTSKMVETTSAFSTKGIKQSFKAHPVLKTIEAALAGGVIYGDIKGQFADKVTLLQKQLELINTNFRQSFQKENISQLTVGFDDSGNDIIVALGDFIRANQIYYAIQTTQDPKLFALAFSMAGWDEENLNFYLNGAEQLNYIDSKTKNEILKTFVQLQSSSQDSKNSSFINALVSFFEAIIPKFVKEYDKKAIKNMAFVEYNKKNAILSTKNIEMQGLTAQAAELRNKADSKKQ